MNLYSTGFVWLAIPLMAFAAGCKPPKDANISTTQSLDNLANQASGGDTHENSCGLPFTNIEALPSHVQKMATSRFIRGSKEMRNEVLGTLAAVPPMLIAPLAMANGRIIVARTTKSAQKMCADTAMSAAETKLAKGKPVDTCWRTKPVAIILPPSKAKIRHGLLRATAYFYTEFFINRAEKAEKPFNQPEWRQELRAFNSVKDDLKDAYLSDVEQESPKTAKSLTTALPPDLLANYIYAEALDSYYCSRSLSADSSRGIFKTRFPKAWKVFTNQKNDNAPVRLFGG